MLNTIIDPNKVEKNLISALDEIHTNGPENPELLFNLAIIKKYYPDLFQKFENKVICSLGLFYKPTDTIDIFGMAYSVWANVIQEQFGAVYTPTQASIKQGIEQNIFFSFSAPTSAGKSFLFQDLIRNASQDIVIIVPSRALIAEYVTRVRKVLWQKKDVLILNFVDNINKSRTSRRVFILTPERAIDLANWHFPIELFLFDEAQLADDKEIRGITFDVSVRRASTRYPDAKKIFAHPFVSNPQAQFARNNITRRCSSHAYKQHSVGKIFLEKQENKFSLFNPYIANGHIKNNKLNYSGDIIDEILQVGKRLLVYISKNSIYNRSCIDDFKSYIDKCSVLQDENALAIISAVKDSIAADHKNSDLIALMHKGIVIHHGSIPLNVRFLIEKFINEGYAKICFATSTLLQGVNMPFDAVWVYNFRFEGAEEDCYLALKNLIGRAGRSNNMTPTFDYGYVITSNSKRMCENIRHEVSISDVSRLDASTAVNDNELNEIIDAVKNNTYDDIYKMPTTRIERLSSQASTNTIKALLRLIFRDSNIISGDEYRALPQATRKEIKSLFKHIFEVSLSRPLTTGEQSVLSTALAIFLWKIQGKTFKEIVGIRYAYITDMAMQRQLQRQLRDDQISLIEYKSKFENIQLKSSPNPYTLPNKRLLRAPVNFNSTLKNFNYDHLVYDTYDYLDKVISFSLTDVYVTAFDIFYKTTADIRAQAMVNYLRYGTNDETEIWLLRYGFTVEDIEMIKKYVISVNENELKLSPEVITLQDLPVYQLIERYM